MIMDEQWSRIADLLSRRATDKGRTAVDNRLFVEAVFYMVAVSKAKCNTSVLR